MSQSIAVIPHCHSYLHGQDVLRAEYPRGVDVVYESVGGDMFRAAVDGLADRGRLVVIGMMGAYSEGWPPSNHPGLAEKLLW
jgi:NADPH-dependent curcumin reductase CurA